MSVSDQGSRTSSTGVQSKSVIAKSKERGKEPSYRFEHSDLGHQRLDWEKEREIKREQEIEGRWNSDGAWREKGRDKLAKIVAVSPKKGWCRETRRERGGFESIVGVNTYYYIGLCSLATFICEMMGTSSEVWTTIFICFTPAFSCFSIISLSKRFSSSFVKVKVEFQLLD
jgi:hypothetical protein